MSKDLVMSKVKEPTFEGCEPSMLFREFAAECAELAQGTPSPEKRSSLGKERLSGARRIAANVAKLPDLLRNASASTRREIGVR